MSQDVSKTFCILPWIHLNVMPDSTVLPCCLSPYDDIYGKGSEQSFNEIINSEKFKNLRKNMLNGHRSESCKRCYQIEETGFQSLRMEMNNSFGHHIPLSEKTLKDGSIREMPLKYIDVRFSNLCNFKCRGCGPALSSAWYEDHQIVYNYKTTQNKVNSVSSHSPAFWEELKRLIPEAEIIYFAGGEPLIMKEHFEILTLLIEKKKFNIELRYNTNLSQLSYGDHNLSLMWSQFQKVTLGISIDDIGPRSEYFRHGTKWEFIERNLSTLINLYPNINRTINCTINIMNVFYFPEILQYIFDQKITVPDKFFINLLLDPIEYRIDVLPPQMKQKVKNKLTKYKYYLLGFEDKYLKTTGDIDNIIKFMTEKDLSIHLSLFKESTTKLDLLRKENFKTIFPELTELIS